MRTLFQTEVTTTQSKARSQVKHPPRIQVTDNSRTVALVTSVNMSGSIATTASPKFSSPYKKSRRNNNNNDLRMNTEDQQQQQHPTLKTISNPDELISSPYDNLCFPSRRRTRKETHSNGSSLMLVRNSSKTPRQSNANSNSSSSSASSSFLGFRERFHRWHMFNSNHQDHHSQDHPKPNSSSNGHNRNSIQTYGTSTTTLHSFNSASHHRPSNTTISNKSSSRSGSSLLSLRRLSSGWSIHHAAASTAAGPPPPTTTTTRSSVIDVYMASNASISCKNIMDTVKEEEGEETPLDGTTNHSTPPTTTPPSSHCPTSLFFATKSNESSTIAVQDLEMVLDASSGQIGIYSGTLNMKTKTPHGQGKMMYIATPDSIETLPDQQQQHKQPEAVVHEEEEDIMCERAVVLIYDGQWQNGDWCGFGTLVDVIHGHTYEGGFFDNYKHGLGVLQYADGRVYDGIFAFGKLEGKGHLEYPDGTTYWGHWTSDGIEHGRGKKVFVDGSVYDGEFDNGVLHGHGRMTFADGSWYLGEWTDGEPNGLGLQVLPNGTLMFEGTFIHGRPIEGSSVPCHHKKSDGDFLCYRSSLAKHGTLVGNIPKHLHMRDDGKLKWAK